MEEEGKKAESLELSLNRLGVESELRLSVEFPLAGKAEERGMASCDRELELEEEKEEEEEEARSLINSPYSFRQ